MTNRVFHSITTLPGGEPAVNGRESRGQTETTSPSGRNNTTEQKEAQEPIPPVTDVSRYVSEHGEIDRFAVIMDLALPLAWHAFVLYRGESLT